MAPADDFVPRGVPAQRCRGQPSPVRCGSNWDSLGGPQARRSPRYWAAWGQVRADPRGGGLPREAFRSWPEPDRGFWQHHGVSWERSKRELWPLLLETLPLLLPAKGGGARSGPRAALCWCGEPGTVSSRASESSLDRRQPEILPAD